MTTGAELMDRAIDHEWSLKGSLEARGQFIVATGASLTALAVTAFVFAIDKGLELGDREYWAIAVVGVTALAATLLGVASVLPFAFDGIDSDSLAGYSAKPDQQIDEHNLFDVRLRQLRSLERLNRAKSMMLTLSSVCLAATATGSTLLLMFLIPLS